MGCVPKSKMTVENVTPELCPNCALSLMVFRPTTGTSFARATGFGSAEHRVSLKLYPAADKDNILRQGDRKEGGLMNGS
jgi:hypothetical protein